MKTLNIIRTLWGKEWGADRETLLRIYNSFILSRLRYCSVAYTSANKTDLALLNPLHNLGIRLATGAFRTSPSDSIIAESGQLPLQYMYARDLVMFLLKVKSQPNHPLQRYLAQSNILNYLYKNIRSKRGILREIEEANELNINVENIELTQTQSTEPPWLLTPVKTFKNVFNNGN